MPSYSMSGSLTRFALSRRDPRILAAELAVQADRPLLARAVELEWPEWSGELAAGRTQRPDRRTRPVAPATAHSSPNKAPDRNLVLGVPGGHIKPAARHWVWQRRHGAATRLRPHAVRNG